MAMFQKEGKSAKPVIPEKTKIENGEIQGPVQLHFGPYFARLWNNTMGRITGDYSGATPREPGSEPPPRRQAYSREGYVDPRIGNFARGYAEAARDINRKGWNLVRLPGSKMSIDPDGYEKDMDIFENRDNYGLDGLKVRCHEMVGKNIRAYGLNHDARFDRAMRPLEEEMAVAYQNGERDVLNRFTRRAMQALMN